VRQWKANGPSDIGERGGSYEANLETLLAGCQPQAQSNLGFTGSARPKGNGILVVIHERATIARQRFACKS